MKQRRYFPKILILSLALFFAVPVLSTLQEPIQAEAAAPKLSKKKASVKEKKSITLTVKNPTQKVTWKSSNSKVVKIIKKTGSKKSKATLKGMKKGTATITAKVGKKKLTAKITVKHVHKWRGYATCTEPDKCTACGATRGSAMGHSWNPATCQKPAICQRCGTTQGGLGAHVWDENEICSVCSTLNISRILEMRITNVGSDMWGAIVEVVNRGGQTFMLANNGILPVPATLTTNGRTQTVYLYDWNTGNFLTTFLGGPNTNLRFYIESDRLEDRLTMTFNSSVVFDISYFNQKTRQYNRYRATVTPGGCTYVKY